MTEMRDAIIFVGFWRPPNAPPPPPMTPQYLTILIDREKGRHYRLKDFGAPQCPPPPSPQTPQYLTILITEGAPSSFVRFWRPPPPPSRDATILINDLNG